MQPTSESMDSSELAVWIVAALFIIIFVLPNILWPGFYTNIWMKVKLFELTTIVPVVDLLLPRTVGDKFYFYIDRLSSLSASDIKMGHILEVERLSLMVYGWIPLSYIVYASLKILKQKPENKGMLDLESLIELQTRTQFRFNRHLIKHNPLKDPRLDMTRGRYATRMQPIEYCKKLRIITLSKDTVREDEAVYIFHPKTAKAALLETLGTPYLGPDSLQREERWMLAAFLLFLSGKSDKYHDLLGDISCAIAEEKEKDIEIGFKLVDEKTSRIISSTTKDDKVAEFTKSILKDDSIGSDSSKLVRSFVNLFSLEFNVNYKKVLAPLLVTFPHELSFMNSEVASNSVPYETAVYLPLAEKAVIATLITSVKESEDSALAMARQLQGLILETNRLAEEEDELIELENRIDVVLLSHIEKTPAETYKIACRKHHYSHGVLLRLYRECAEFGVICASRFTWLMLYNRALYLTLLDEGMPEHSIEVTATRTHFNSEIEADRKLKKPEIAHQVEEIKKRLLERLDIEDE